MLTSQILDVGKVDPQRPESEKIGLGRATFLAANYTESIETTACGSLEKHLAQEA